MIHFANVVKLVLILLLDKISDKYLPILHGYSKDFFFFINIYTKSNKTKLHATVPRRHILRPVWGELKC